MYKGIICAVNCYPHPDTRYTEIQLANASGNTVVVGKNVKSGDVGVYFGPDGCLSQEYCLGNSLFRKHPETGEPMGGYLEDNARVKSLKFGGVKSDGLWMPLKSLSVFGEIPKYVVDDLIDSVNGKELCKKYYTPATLRAMSRKSKQVKATLKDKKVFVFPKHYDTEQFKYNFHRVPKGAIVYMTEKLHGTSSRHVYTNVETNHFRWWQKLLFKVGLGKFFRFKPATYNDWEHLVGSRNVVLNEDEKGFYESDKFRFNIAKQIEPFIRKNEVVYGEIVGYTDTNRLIMPSVSTDVLKDKTISRKYGKQMVYKYGCAVGHCDFYVYRISNINPDGVEIDLSWNQVKKRCMEMSLKHVPEIGSFINNLEPEELLQHCSVYMVGESMLDSSHIREGVCIRVESENGINVYKHKSWEFLVMEGVMKDRDDYVDVEETA